MKKQTTSTRMLVIVFAEIVFFGTCVCSGSSLQVVSREPAEAVHLVQNFGPGTDVVIFKTISPKNLGKILALFAQTTACF
jgi:hypothetical protein